MSQSDQTKIIVLTAQLTAERLKWSTALDLAKVKQKSLEDALTKLRAMCDINMSYQERLMVRTIDSVMGVKE
jgi:hypothetical protein